MVDFFAARRVLATVPFFPDDFLFAAALVGRFLAVFFAGFFRPAFLVTGALRAFFLAAFFFVAFLLAAFFLVAVFLAAFFVAFFPTDFRRAEARRVALALVFFFLVAAFLAGIASASKAEFEERAIIHRPRPSGSLQAENREAAIGGTVRAHRFGRLFTLH